MSTQAMIFNIQKFSIHDGPGIRTVVFLKGCSLNCQWCANPESHSVNPELLYNPNKCIVCRECLEKCSTGAIEEVNEVITFNPSLCNNCLKCTEVCNTGARKASGKLMSVKEVLKEVEKDMVFYEGSGGGITFSGGEPLLWPDFIKELSTNIKICGGNIVIETCGYYPKENFEIIKAVADLLLFDIKLINEQKHIKYCGESNKPILSNFKTVIQHIDTIIRIPVIPGINDTLNDLDEIINFLAPYKNKIKGINLLPYHNLGVSKYDALSKPYLLHNITAPTQKYMEQIRLVFESENYKTKIGG